MAFPLHHCHKSCRWLVADVWRAVCFKIPERQSFKAPERQGSEAPKRQSSSASECDTLFFHKFFSRWWIRTSCLVVYRFHQMAAAVDLHVAGIVSFLFFFFLSDFTEDEDLSGLGHVFKFVPVLRTNPPSQRIWPFCRSLRRLC